ncbi:MAG: hypothetical protein WD208_11350 [Dehalococcoidia bacterium]
MARNRDQNGNKEERLYGPDQRDIERSNQKAFEKPKERKWTTILWQLLAALLGIGFILSLFLIDFGGAPPG